MANNTSQWSKWYLAKVAGSEVRLLPKGISMVGRLPGSTIKLSSIFCSRKHCHFNVDSAGAIKVVDFSTNGTFVNGSAYVNVDVALSEGDRIGIGCEAEDDITVAEGNLPIYILKVVPENAGILLEQVPLRPPELLQVCNAGNASNNDRESDQLKSVVNERIEKNANPIIDISDSDNDEHDPDRNLVQSKPTSRPIIKEESSGPIIKEESKSKELDVRLTMQQELKCEEPTDPAILQLEVNLASPQFLPTAKPAKPTQNLNTISGRIKNECVIDISDSDDESGPLGYNCDLAKKESEGRPIIKVESKSKELEGKPITDERLNSKELAVPALAQLGDSLANAQFLRTTYQAKASNMTLTTTLASAQFLNPADVKSLIVTHQPNLNHEKIIPPTSGIVHCSEDDIFDISDDEENENASKYSSQSFLHDIKQEYAGFDFEESFENAPSLDNQLDVGKESDGTGEKNNQESIVPSDYCENRKRSPSPMFAWLDDESDSEIMSNWVMKLSQSFTTTTPAAIERFDETRLKCTTAIATTETKSAEKKQRRFDNKRHDETSSMSRRSSSKTSSKERKQTDNVEIPCASKTASTRSSSTNKGRKQTDIKYNEETPYTSARASTRSSSTKKGRKQTDIKQNEEVPSTSRRASIRISRVEGTEKGTEIKDRNTCASTRTSTRKDSGYFQASAPKRKPPEVIVAPSLPINRGKLRGVSAHVSPRISTKQYETEKKLHAIRARDRLAHHEKSLKEKWHKKPSLSREEQKLHQQDLQEERKMKLKEIAESEAQARKRKSQNDEKKVIKKPKVKITLQNRGAFLTTELETAKQNVLSIRIPKLKFIKPVEDSIQHNRNSIECCSMDRSLKPIENETNIRRVQSLNSAASSILHTIDVLDGPTILDRYNKSSNKTKEDSRRHGPSHENDRCIPAPNKKPIRRKTSDIKSILKPFDKIGKNNYNRSVKFSDLPDTVRYFDIDDGNFMMRSVNAKDVPMDLSSFLNHQNSQNRKRQIQATVDYSEFIVTDILGWDPNWFETQKPDVNGPSHTLLPMLHQFKNFEEFSKIVLPLLKIEIWHSIENDFRDRPSIKFVTFKMNQLVVEKRAKSQRYICHCEINSNSLPAQLKQMFVKNELCIVKAGRNNLQLFGSISATRNLNASLSSVLQLAVELNGNPTHHQVLQSVSSLQIKPISNLRVEIGAFNAVNYLKYSPLGECILNPFELIRNSNVKKNNVRYKGHDALNENQQSILIQTYLKSIETHQMNNISLIEGPPGTGKSRLISNLAMQILYGDEVRMLSKKILICSQNNAAIDVIALKLLELRRKMDRDKFNLVRFGILERIHPNVQCVSIQKLISSNLRAKQTESERTSLKDELRILDAQIADLSVNSGPDNVLQDDIKKLEHRRKKIEQLLDNNPTNPQLEYPKYLGGAHIVCTTLSSCIKLLQYATYFDICIIDEATQCLEPWTLIPLQFGLSSLVLVGDTQQLPATCFSAITNEYGFGVSLFTRIQKCLQGSKNNPIQMLRTQYRMHPEICQWPNSYFYKNMLISDKSTSDVASLIKPYSVFSLEYHQKSDPKKGNISNVFEAQFVVQLILNVSNFIPTSYFSYAVITPYVRQRDYLQEKINEAGIKNVSVNTIDSYQGKEKDVIIISCARTKGVGFLGNCQRLNVALTRAKKCLIVCGNFSSLESEPVWKSLLENSRRRGLFYHVKQDFDNNVMCHLKIKI